MHRHGRRSFLASKARELVPFSPGFFGGGTATDPYFSSVIALLHLDGTNGSTTFTDVKGHTFTGAGTAALSTATYKFGGAALNLAGAGAFISTAHADFNLLSGGDYTVECWANLFSSPPSSYGCVVFSKDTPTGGFILRVGPTLAMEVVFPSLGVMSSPWGVPPGVWTHLGYCRAGSTHYLFMNGAVFSTSAFNRVVDAASAFRVGASSNAGYEGYWLGQIDEVRVTKGVARYTSAYSTPASPFPNS